MVRVLTIEIMHDVLFLCNELNFTGLLSQVSGFISAQWVADDEAR
jgi:hypothetical protein